MKVSKINEWFEKFDRFLLKHRWAILLTVIKLLATPVSFKTEVTLRFDGGRIFFNPEFLKLVVYFYIATSLGDNYIGIEGMNELTSIKFEVMKGG